MGVRGVVCAIVLAGVALVPSESGRAGCNPNLAWQDRNPSWGASTIAFARESVGCGGAPELVGHGLAGRQARALVGAGNEPRSVSARGNVAYTNEFSAIEIDGVEVSGGEYPAWSPRGIGSRSSAARDSGCRNLGSDEERRLAAIAVFSPFTQAPVTTPSWSSEQPRDRLRRPRPEDLRRSRRTAPASGSSHRASTARSARRGAPDGERILYASDRGDSFDIWSIRPDGSGNQRLTDGPQDETLPAWSPSGGRIAYIQATVQSYGEAVLRTMGRDGAAQSTVGADAHGFSQPAWSFDGRSSSTPRAANACAGACM